MIRCDECLINILYKRKNLTDLYTILLLAIYILVYCIFPKPIEYQRFWLQTFYKSKKKLVLYVTLLQRIIAIVILCVEAASECKYNFNYFS